MDADGQRIGEHEPWCPFTRNEARRLGCLAKMRASYFWFSLFVRPTDFSAPIGRAYEQNRPCAGRIK
ncbi:hypothetical protein [Azospirillum doebereinerae]